MSYLIKGLLVIILVFPQGSIAQSGVEKFESANEAYRQGQYDSAIRIYNQLLEDSVFSGELYHNLGTAYLKSDSIAQAVLYLEKAFKLKPSNPDISNNLELARERVESDIIEVPDFILFRWWNTFTLLFPPVIWLIAMIIIGMLILFWLYLWFFSINGKVGLRGFIASCLLFAMLIITLLAGIGAAENASSRDKAIVMGETVLYEAPDKRAPEKISLFPGMKVSVLDSIGDWYKVELINKDEGWIPREAVVFI